MDAATDNLKWCLSERFFSEEGFDRVMRGHNECVSLYCRPDGFQSAVLAKGLEEIVGPVRRENAIRLLDEIEELSAAVRKAVLAGE